MPSRGAASQSKQSHLTEQVVLAVSEANAILINWNVQALGTVASDYSSGGVRDLC